MITLTFETWEEWDKAIGNVTNLVIALNEKETN